MEILTRLFPYMKTVAGLKTALTQVLRFREPTGDTGRKATRLRAQLRPPFSWSLLKQRGGSRELFTAQLAGIVFQLTAVTVANERSLISSPLSKWDGFV